MKFALRKSDACPHFGSSLQICYGGIHRDSKHTCTFSQSGQETLPSPLPKTSHRESLSIPAPPEREHQVGYEGTHGCCLPSLQCQPTGLFSSTTMQRVFQSPRQFLPSRRFNDAVGKNQPPTGDKILLAKTSSCSTAVCFRPAGIFVFFFFFFFKIPAEEGIRLLTASTFTLNARGTWCDVYNCG